VSLLSLVTFVALTYDATDDALHKGANPEIIGWSADETHFAVRAVEYDNSEEGGPECPGYVDPKGKPFRGKLVLAAYERGGKRLSSWTVQDYPGCTAPAVAKKTLAAAKQKFAELGIDLKRPGTAIHCQDSCDLQHAGAQLVYENTVTEKLDRDSAMIHEIGAVRLFLKLADKKTKLFELKVDEEYVPAMGMTQSVGLDTVFISPSGQAVFLRAFRGYYSGRGSGGDAVPIGYFEWEGDVLKKR
jgi:hypothetical protein